MRLVHAQDVSAPIEEVWASFTDLRTVGRCFPGARVTEVTGTDFVGEVVVRLGVLTLGYDGSGRLACADEEARRAVVVATGSERHGLGSADITITVDLAEGAGGATHVSVTTDLSVRGAPADLGGGLAQRASDPLVRSFIACMGGEAAASGDAPLDLGRSVLPGLVSSYGRSLRGRLGRRP